MTIYRTQAFPSPPSTSTHPLAAPCTPRSAVVWCLTAAAALLTAGIGCGADVPASVEEPAAEAASDGHGGSVWGAQYFPNTALTTHHGEEVRFFDDLIKDKVVAVNFIYTSCPDACPMETARLLEVYRLLGDRMGRDVHFYSITIDPEYDTPEVLRDYAARWGIEEGWTFLTGDREEIIALRKKLGVFIPESRKQGPNDHNLSLVIGNQKTGRWMKRSPYENPYILAEQLGSWLHNWKLPRQEDRSYADAPEVRSIGRGENLFRTRCASCHTIGLASDAPSDQHRVGPDLLGVTDKRDAAWLHRWIREPDRMIEDGDPIAVALLAEYDGIPMPNLRLEEVDVVALVEFLRSETERIQATAETELATAEDSDL